MSTIWRLVTLSTRMRRIGAAWRSRVVRQAHRILSGWRQVGASRSMTACAVSATVGTPGLRLRGSPPARPARAFASAASRASAKVTSG